MRRLQSNRLRLLWQKFLENKIMTIREYYSHAKADDNKKRKYTEAKERSESRKQRTAKQQLKKLDIEGRIAKKERKRLEKTQ